MRYYIILQPSIYSIAGEEMYTRNKVISAREMGYSPIVFHSGMGGDTIFIDDLKPFSQYEFAELRYEPCTISNNRKKKLLKRLMSILKDCDAESIIESHEILVAEWGEWIAKEMGIRHFAYMLLEHNTLTFKPLYDFFRFKYDRRELAGIADETIPDMFVNYDSRVIGYRLPAHCVNVYEDIPCPSKYRLPEADYTIGTIGRTNKQYVQPMIDSILTFVSKHRDLTFNILYVGGSMDKQSERQVIKRLSSTPNAKLTFTGLLFPLSVEMIRQMDVCLASAGSCVVSCNCGVPTISIDGNDSKAIGVYKMTTNHRLFRSKDEQPIEIESLLDEVLIQGKYRKTSVVELLNIDLTSHWEFINQMSPRRDYYNIDQIKYPLKRRMISRFLGFYYGLKPNSFLRCSLEMLIRHRKFS